jgi:tetratricopeptide (TPR) repeat protein
MQALMHRHRGISMVLTFLIGSVFQIALAQDISLEPKYGSQPKNEAQKAADTQFLATIDEQYKGDRKQAADDLSNQGWQFLRQGNVQDAMKRFNQAWLIDRSKGSALWGMAVIQAGSGKFDEALKLFAEADPIMGSDIDFSTDYAKATGIAWVQAKNDALLEDALSRFAQVYEKAPQHTLNLQNWAITLFYVGNYAEAWNRIKLAEATPRHADLDPSFILNP